MALNCSYRIILQSYKVSLIDSDTFWVAVKGTVQPKLPDYKMTELSSEEGTEDL